MNFLLTFAALLAATALLYRATLSVGPQSVVEQLVRVTLADWFGAVIVLAIVSAMVAA